MDAQREWMERIEHLILKGEELPVANRSDPQVTRSYEHGPFRGWKAQVLNALTSLLGAQHTYTEQFRAAAGEGWWTEGQAALAVLRAVHEDLGAGFLLRSLEATVAAEVFSDFLRMAADLLDHGYKDAAASLLGAVLEDGLRRVAAANGLTVGSNLESLNDVCQQGRIYNRLLWNQVRVWTKLRNHADHGEFGEYSEADVRAMHSGVQGFLTQYAA